MATMTEAPETISKQMNDPPSHQYHAEAHVLSGELKRPVEQKIERHAPVELSGRRASHLTRIAEDVSIEGLISFKRGHTRVSGSKTLKNDPKHHGWVTLSTSILEGLNVFEVITADRMVSQVSTDHPEVDGHFPHVTFLGTQFSNLQVAGFPLTPTLDFGICGNKPDGDKSYLDELRFLKLVQQQTEKIAQAGDLPKDLQKTYDDRLAAVEKLIDNGGSKGSHEAKVTCSLVTSIDRNIEKAIRGVRVIGHVLVIPDFGTVSLGEIEVGERKYEGSPKLSNYFELTVIKMSLGCIGAGSLSAGTTAANGGHKP